MESPTPRAIDVRELVADIEATVAARRASGGYPLDLLKRLRSEFAPDREDEPLEARTTLITHELPRSVRPLLGGPITFSRRALRRFIAWYVQPIARQQSDFNAAITRELRTIQSRVERLEVPWARTVRQPALDAARGLTEVAARARIAALTAAIPSRGPVLVLGPLPPELAGLVAGRQHVNERPAEGAASADPLAQLEVVPGGTLAAVLIPGVLGALPASDLVAVVAAAAARLAPGGRLLVESPLPGRAREPSAIDPALRRWVLPETVALLCEAAGLAVVEVHRSADAEWFLLTASRPAR